MCGVSLSERHVTSASTVAACKRKHRVAATGIEHIAVLSLLSVTHVLLLLFLIGSALRCGARWGQRCYGVILEGRVVGRRFKCEGTWGSRPGVPSSSCFMSLTYCEGAGRGGG